MPCADRRRPHLEGQIYLDTLLPASPNLSQFLCPRRDVPIELPSESYPTPAPCSFMESRSVELEPVCTATGSNKSTVYRLTESRGLPVCATLLRSSVQGRLSQIAFGALPALIDHYSLIIRISFSLDEFDNKDANSKMLPSTLLA